MTEREPRQLTSEVYAEFSGSRIKHLEFIQQVIARLGNNSFLVKGWAVTVSGIFFGFAVDSKDPGLSVVSALPTFSFWVLDAYFLRCERLFRELYERVRTADRVEPFFMSATHPDFVETTPVRASSPVKVFVSSTLRGFYLPLLGASAVVSVVLATGVLGRH